MNDTTIKNFCIWARNELRQQVVQQALLYGITEDGYGDANAEIIEGRVLTSEEKRERANLIQAYLGKVDEGYPDRYNALIERAAYTWFNRFAAIRFMEVNGRLFSRVRMFSDPEGNFAPQVLKEALEVQIEGVDKAKVADLLDVGDDEALFRYLFLAQCDELARCMPEVFEPIGSALELLLPQNLLRNGSVVERMVADIPEEDWQEGVQIVGWMYQYYNAELKDEVFALFKKGKKADAAALAPATQLFTPDWIVQYLVENSLGRLWVRSHPGSGLVDQMHYYIPDSDEVAISADTVLSPESITLVDPACGSGHILVYAFELLGRIYEEAGYTRRDIPQLVLTKNLSGIEIDPRAAQWAAFALYMAACEYDSRFLRRGVQPQITTLELVAFEDEEVVLLPGLADHAKLLDAMEHMNECGSLFVPDEADLVAIDGALESLRTSNSLFANSALGKLEQMKKNCQPLARTYDVVVANPPYMGSKNMAKWLSDWTKKNYPNVKGDLFSCFIERNLRLVKEGGQLGFMTPYVWMFIGSYEKLRHKILHDATITSLVQLEYSGFAGATVPICTFTLQKGQIPGYLGGYVRLADFSGSENQGPKTLEAIANPDCGWFYRRSADAFSAIPGTPIAYWASDKMIRAFQIGKPLKHFAKTPEGLKTGDNEKFLRFWWECQLFNSLIKKSKDTYTECIKKYKWFPCNKGGQYRKWFGNNEYLIDFENNGSHLLNDASKEKRSVSCYDRDLLFAPLLSWSRISSGKLAIRYFSAGSISETTGPAIFSTDETLSLLQGFLNSDISSLVASILSPTLDFRPGQLSLYPIVQVGEQGSQIIEFVGRERSLAKLDWDSFETSWDFKRHPMV